MLAKAIRTSANVSAAGTLLQLLAASNRPLKIIDFGVYCEGIDNLGKPLHFQLVIQTTAGTGGGTNTPKKLSRLNGSSIQTTALDDSSAWSVQPTDSDILHEWYVHPQGGSEHPPVQPWEIAAAERVAIRLMEAAGATTELSCYIEFEE